MLTQVRRNADYRERISVEWKCYVRVMKPAPDDTNPGLSRSGLLLGAAGAVGAAALAALPGTAEAATGPVRTTLRNTTKFSVTTHPHYNRRHFDRAKAIAKVLAIAPPNRETHDRQ